MKAPYQQRNHFIECLRLAAPVHNGCMTAIRRAVMPDIAAGMRDEWRCAGNIIAREA